MSWSGVNKTLHGLDGAVPALPGGSPVGEFVGARPRTANGFVPAQSTTPWRPQGHEEQRLPCSGRKDDGSPCRARRVAYPNGTKSELCVFHWQQAIKYDELVQAEAEASAGAEDDEFVSIEDVVDTFTVDTPAEPGLAAEADDQE